MASSVVSEIQQYMHDIDNGKDSNAKGYREFKISPEVFNPLYPELRSKSSRYGKIRYDNKLRLDYEQATGTLFIRRPTAVQQEFATRITTHMNHQLAQYRNFESVSAFVDKISTTTFEHQAERYDGYGERFLYTADITFGSRKGCPSILLNVVHGWNEEKYLEWVWKILEVSYMNVQMVIIIDIDYKKVYVYRAEYDDNDDDKRSSDKFYLERPVAIAKKDSADEPPSTVWRDRFIRDRVLSFGGDADDSAQLDKLGFQLQHFSYNGNQDSNIKPEHNLPEVVFTAKQLSDDLSESEAQVSSGEHETADLPKVTSS